MTIDDNAELLKDIAAGAVVPNIPEPVENNIMVNRQAFHESEEEKSPAQDDYGMNMANPYVEVTTEESRRSAALSAAINSGVAKIPSELLNLSNNLAQWLATGAMPGTPQEGQEGVSTAQDGPPTAS